jgi:Spondin_N
VKKNPEETETLKHYFHFPLQQTTQKTISDVFLQEFHNSGELVGNLVEGKGFFVDQKKWDENFVYLPPLVVDKDHSFISGIAAISPSPDWYSGFYLFDTLKEDTSTYYESFKIRTYPWDAGTDDGDSYTAQDRDTDPPGLITRIEVGNTVNGIFLSPAGDTIPYLAEWECVLNTCPSEDPECEKPDWPPANKCDVLRYPQCNATCNPDVEMDCEQCKRESNNEEKVYHQNCCLAGREPKDGTCEAEVEGDNKTSGTAGFSCGLTIATFIIINIALLL